MTSVMTNGGHVKVTTDVNVKVIASEMRYVKSCAYKENTRFAETIIGCFCSILDKTAHKTDTGICYLQ